MRKCNGLKIFSFFAAMLCFGISHAWGVLIFTWMPAQWLRGDGTSWATAFTDLRDALAAADDEAIAKSVIAGFA